MTPITWFPLESGKPTIERMPKWLRKSLQLARLSRVVSSTEMGALCVHTHSLMPPRRMRRSSFISRFWFRPTNTECVISCFWLKSTMLAQGRSSRSVASLATILSSVSSEMAELMPMLMSYRRESSWARVSDSRRFLRSRSMLPFMRSWNALDRKITRLTNAPITSSEPAR